LSTRVREQHIEIPSHDLLGGFPAVLIHHRDIRPSTSGDIENLDQRVVDSVGGEWDDVFGREVAER
jgi:hypothetical protein